MLWLGPTASTDAATLRKGHIGKSTGFWDARFAHQFRLSLERRGAGGSEGLARPLQEEEQVRPHTDTAVALVQDTEQDHDARNDVKDDATSPIAAIHLAHTG